MNRFERAKELKEENADKILVHLESIPVEKPMDWPKMTPEERHRYLNTQICLIQPSVNDWELLE